jgi:hypothetical protein
MFRRAAFIAMMVGATIASAEDELPQRDSSDALDIEPPLLIKDGKPLAPLPTASVAPNDPEQLQLTLDRAQRSAASAERQFKAGIIAKVQVEERALKVVRIEADLADARLQIAKHEHEAREQRFAAGELAKSELDNSAAAVAAAEEQARLATANREGAEIEAARANVQRQQKLLALGSGRKADVNRAQEKLSELTREAE